MHAVSDIASEPAQTCVQQTGKPGSLFTSTCDLTQFAGTGERGGERINVEPAGVGMITAYPVQGKEDLRGVATHRG
jgi:hypothetical protein